MPLETTNEPKFTRIGPGMAVSIGLHPWLRFVFVGVHSWLSCPLAIQSPVSLSTR
jgi:hypothetical protein